MWQSTGNTLLWICGIFFICSKSPKGDTLLHLGLAAWGWLPQVMPASYFEHAICWYSAIYLMFPFICSIVILCLLLFVMYLITSFQSKNRAFVDHTPAGQNSVLQVRTWSLWADTSVHVKWDHYSLPGGLHGLQILFLAPGELELLWYLAVMCLSSQAWWGLLIISALESQVDQEVKANLGYVKPCLKKKKTNRAGKMAQWVKGTCSQTWWPEFNAWNTHGRRREQSLPWVWYNISTTL